MSPGEEAPRPLWAAGSNAAQTCLLYVSFLIPELKVAAFSFQLQILLWSY